MPIALLLLILCSEMGIMSIRKRGDSECVDKCEDVRKKKTISFGFEETTGYYGLVVTFDMQIPRTRVAPLAHPDTRVKPDNNPGCEWFVLFFFFVTGPILKTGLASERMIGKMDMLNEGRWRNI